MRIRAIVLAAGASLLAVAAPVSLAAPASPSLERAGGKVTLHITGSGNADATNGAVAGVGRFTISGAITDKGTGTAYRTVKPTTVLLRHVLVGKKGTINLLVTIDISGGTKLWKIISGTKAYKGLHGKGTEDSAIFTGDKAVLTLTGTVFR
jgi:hypothetical protein